MAREAEIAFGPTVFRIQGHADAGGYWFHFDAKERKIGGPYSEVYVGTNPVTAEVTDQWRDAYWLVGFDGKKLADRLLHGNRKGHKDGPGPIAWAGPHGEGFEEATALRPDGTVIGVFDRISVEPHQDVRWVYQCNRWRLLRADGKLAGLKGITHAWDFGKEGLALARIGKRYVFLTTEGRRRWREAYLDAYDFCEGRAWVQGSSGWALIDTEGRRVRDMFYDEVADSDGFPYVAARRGGEWFIVRRSDGAHVPDEPFEEVQRDNDEGHGVAFTARRGSVRETINAKTGARKPYDASRAYARAMAAAGMGGGEFDD